MCPHKYMHSYCSAQLCEIVIEPPPDTQRKKDREKVGERGIRVVVFCYLLCTAPPSPPLPLPHATLRGISTAHGKGYQDYSTVRTVAADLRRGEHIPKMQNNIGRKSILRVLRQLKSKDGAGERGRVPYRTVPCRAGPRRAAFGLVLRSPQLP